MRDLRVRVSGREAFAYTLIQKIMEEKGLSNMKIPHDHDPRAEMTLAQMPVEEDMIKVSGLMKQIGDPSRLKIFWILCHVEECVIDIAAMAGMSSSAVSHHLRLLKSAGLITSRREGKEMYYRLADTDVARKLHYAVEEILEISCSR